VTNPNRGLTVGKQMSRRKITQANTPKEWRKLMLAVRQARIAGGKSTRDIADHFGTTVGVVGKWERAERTVHPHDLLEFLDLLGMELVIQEKE